LYKILIKFGIPMKLLRLIKMCLGKNLSDMFPIRNGVKQGDALSPKLFNFALENAIKRVQVNQDGLKLYGTHQILVYDYDVNIQGGSIYTTRKNAQAVVVASMEIGLEVNADKTKYMVMSRDSERRMKSQYND